MKICPECKATLADDAAFCHLCGAKLNEVPNGVKQNDVMGEADFQSTEIADNLTAAKSSGKKKGKVIILSVISLIVIVSIIIGSCFLFGKSKKAENIKPLDYALFIKYGELYYSDLKNLEKNKPLQITSKLFDDKLTDAANLYEASRNNVHITADNKIFYIDKLITPEANSYNGYYYNEAVGILYYRDLNKPEEEPVKIDSDVASFSVNPAATFVTYTKYAGSEAFSVYKYNLKKGEREKLAEKTVNVLHPLNNGEKVLYCYDWTPESGCYSVGMVDASGNSTIIERDIDDYVTVSSDFSTIYFVKGGTFYKKPLDGDKVAIIKNIDRVVSFTSDDSFYYIKSEIKSFTYLDFVDDKYYEIDKNMKEPIRPEHPEYDDYHYGTYSEYYAAVDRYYDNVAKYRELYAAYEAKQERDKVREYLRTMDASAEFNSLYYYDGTDSSLISDKYAYSMQYSLDSEGSIINFAERKYTDIPKKVDIYTRNIEEKIREAFDEFIDDVSNGLFCIKGKLFNGPSNLQDDTTDIINVTYDKKNDKYYYISEDTLYSLTLDENGEFVSTPYDSDVQSYVLTDYGIAYIKDFNKESSKGDLYLNKTFIDYDVYIYNLYIYDYDGIVYYTDWNRDKQRGTLKIYKNQNSVKIADDVYDFYYYFENGDVLYLYDYNTERKKGDLIKYSKGESVKVDSDVMEILKFTTTYNSFF